jgi:excinuclease UvrABC nuclease subunit
VLARSLNFSPDQRESFFQELPAAAAVFLLIGEGEPYVSKTANLRRRLQRLLGPPVEHGRRLNLRDRVRQVEFTPTGSDFESQFLLYLTLREIFPTRYAERMRLRPAPLVKLHLQNEYPRASVTTRLGRLDLDSVPKTPSAAEALPLTYLTARLDAPPFRRTQGNDCGAQDSWNDGFGAPGVPARPDGESSSSATPVFRGTGEDARASKIHRDNLYYGPFPSRVSADKFASDALDFFKMRRCVDDLHPDPAFPGCVYSEMKMCLAPCFKGCTDSEYHAEVARVQAFFDSAGESLTREFAEQRDRASAELAFEDAAALHAKIEKLKPLLAQLPEIVRRIDRLEALIVQPTAEAGSVALFRFSAAILVGPVTFNVEQRAASQSMESRIQAIIQTFPATEARLSAERIEHLAILKRWYYRSHRAGEIFFADEKGTWPLRRIVRGIGRVYRGEKQEGPATFSATQPVIPPS